MFDPTVVGGPVMALVSDGGVIIGGSNLKTGAGNAAMMGPLLPIVTSASSLATSTKEK